jgi:hypothetical protein
MNIFPLCFVFIGIEDSRHEKERNKLLLEKTNDEKTRAVNELHTVETSFKDLRVRYEELKTLNEQYRKVSHPRSKRFNYSGAQTIIQYRRETIRWQSIYV